MAFQSAMSRILETNKLQGPNFIDWQRNLKLVLTANKMAYVMTGKPPALGADPTPEESERLAKWLEDDEQARCLAILGMTPELQRQTEKKDTLSEVLVHLTDMYGAESRTQRYNLSRGLFKAQMPEGASVHDHGLKMIDMIEQLTQLGFVMDDELYVDLILTSLPKSFSQFVMNFHMNKIDVTLSELISMLRTAEADIDSGKSKSPALLLPSSSRAAHGKGSASSSSKGKGVLGPVNTKGKDKKKKKKKSKLGALGDISKNKMKQLAAEGACFQCGKTGHWKKDCRMTGAIVSTDRQHGAGPSGVKKG